MAPRNGNAAVRLPELPSLPLLGDLVEGRYRVDGELGRGGMGIVLAASDQTLQRDVALKLLLPEMLASRELFDRFCNEALSLAKLECRHVVKVLDFSVISQPTHAAGLPCMVLERLHGQDLFSYVNEQGTLLPSRVVRLALEACDGLAAAHAAGIIHRDLKPENLFIAIEPDGTEVLKVLDFGIARGRVARASSLGQVAVGSPGYMAPEQVEGSQQLDGRVDIWALGVVMYELLAQRPAFAGETPRDLCVQILTAPIAPLAELRPDLPAALVYVVERCLERDPDRRFLNVAELAEALAPLDDSDPDSAATRARRRLEAVTPLQAGVVRPTPIPGRRSPVRGAQVMTPDVVTPPADGPRPGSRRRRVLSGLVVGLAMVPIVALLPAVTQAPDLAPARTWSEQALSVVQRSWLDARQTWRAYWNGQSSEATPSSSSR